MIVYPPLGLTWNAIVTNVHDGDTVTLDVDLAKKITGKDKTFGFHVYAEQGRLRFHNATRLYGINAPELATPQGVTAAQALQARLPVGSPVLLTTWLNQNDKYGRVLGRVEQNGVDVNQWMVDGGYAVVWYGQGPKP